MPWIKVPAEHHAIFRAALPKDPRVETLPMFGGLAAKVNGNVFAGLFGRSTMIWLPEDERAEALALEGAAPFDPMGDGRARSEKVMLPEAMMEDTAELRRWIARAFKAAAKLPLKVKAAKKAKTKENPMPKKATAKRTSKTDQKANGASKPATPVDAYGLKFLRKGFGKTPEDDVLFALGYPHIVIATDEPMPADLDADRVFKKFSIGTTHVPRPFLGRFYEAIGCGADMEGTAKALKKDPPPWNDARIAKAIKMLLEHGSGYEFLLLEAMIGSEKLAEATTSALEGYPAKAWDGAGGILDSYGHEILNALYFVFLRVPASLRTKLCARLEKLYVRGKKYQGGRPIDALDVLLHGRKGVERGGYRDSDDELFQDLIYADDDPAWVAKTALGVLSHLKPSDYAPFDLRIAFLGGPKVLSAMKSGTNKFPPDARREAKRQLAHVR